MNAFTAFQSRRSEFSHIKTFKTPKDFSVGDVLGLAASPWYIILSNPERAMDPITFGSCVRVRVQHIPDGGCSIREWDWDHEISLPILGNVND